MGQPIEGGLDPILAYTTGAEIEQFQWSSSSPDWGPIAFSSTLQILRNLRLHFRQGLPERAHQRGQSLEALAIDTGKLPVNSFPPSKSCSRLGCVWPINDGKSNSSYCRRSLLWNMAKLKWMQTEKQKARYATESIVARTSFMLILCSGDSAAQSKANFNMDNRQSTSANELFPSRLSKFLSST
ncbi:hypothetical protein RJ640_027934 [Escallonia rubra]|uniref:Uncharacterized protein n=1 Tax=Escallonia rubra TaxID=112253 RepID=A0AA88UPT7_9ASTE|nr:hypothetical protein RJ640_027934 [Escallonia rubra]